MWPLVESNPGSLTHESEALTTWPNYQSGVAAKGDRMYFAAQAMHE